MIITEKTAFLNFPTNPDTERQKLYFYEGNTLLLDLDVQLDLDNPTHVFPYNLKDFMGRNIVIKTECGKELFLGKDLPVSDVFTPAPSEPLRPKLHFTADYGLINDPNGLIFYEGKYHLFYQHNPAGNIMAHMHWGHAVSEDLITWTYLPDALIPDDMGDMWSGSAIVDSQNLLGLNTDEHETLVLFYTAAGDQRPTNKDKVFVQCMAYSTDGGISFKKYENNPVVEHVKGLNRDPKVVFDKKSGYYFMVLYIDGEEFSLLRSKTLTKWELIHTFIPGTTMECPDIFTLWDGGIEKWVFAAGNSCYFVSDLDKDKGFINISGKGRYAYGRIYAGQSWSNLYDRILRIDVQKTRELPTEYFNSFLTFPYVVELKDGQLLVEPAKEIKDTLKPYFADKNTDLNGYSLELPDYSAYIDLTLSDLGPKTKITIFGTEITLDLGSKEISFEDVKMPLYTEDGKCDLTIVADRICFEIYSSNRFVGGKGVVFVGREKMLHFEGNGKIDSIEAKVF